jgi:DNA-binding response OmpR family regulator
MATSARITDGFSRTSNTDVEASPSKMIVFGNLQISLATRELLVEGKSLRLTSDEIDLLIFLTKHPKHFVTSQTSLSTRWNESRTGKTEFLRVLCSLQRKFEEAGVKGRYLRVEPWFLYSFDPDARVK